MAGIYRSFKYHLGVILYSVYMVKYDPKRRVVTLELKDVECCLPPFDERRYGEEFGAKTAEELRLEYKARTALGRNFGERALGFYSQPGVQAQIRKDVDAYIKELKGRIRESSSVAYYLLYPFMHKAVREFRRKAAEEVSPEKLARRAVEDWTTNKILALRKMSPSLQPAVILSSVVGGGSGVDKLFALSVSENKLNKVFERKEKVVKNVMRRLGDVDAADILLYEAIIEEFGTPADYVGHQINIVDSIEDYLKTYEAAVKGAVDFKKALSAASRIGRGVVIELARVDARAIYGLPKDSPLG